MEYILHKNPEGKMVAKNIEWHKENGTYTASYIIGATIVTVGILTLLGICNATAGLACRLLTFGMLLVTLSFLNYDTGDMGAEPRIRRRRHTISLIYPVLVA